MAGRGKIPAAAAKKNFVPAREIHGFISSR